MRWLEQDERVYAPIEPFSNIDSIDTDKDFNTTTYNTFEFICEINVRMRL